MVWYGFQDSWSKDTWSKDTWYKGQKVQRQMVQSDTWYNRQKVQCFVKPDKRSKRQKVLSDKMFKIYSVFFFGAVAFWGGGLLGWWPFGAFYYVGGLLGWWPFEVVAFWGGGLLGSGLLGWWPFELWPFGVAPYICM